MIYIGEYQNIKHRIISGRKNIKHSIQKWRGKYQKSNICGGNIKISNTHAVRVVTNVMVFSSVWICLPLQFHYRTNVIPSIKE